MRLDGTEVARRLVHRRFPDARAAWLGGSVATGTTTSTSDLDITVLLAGPPAPFRESTVSEGWPVELFVQIEDSLMRFCEQDGRRGRPTTMRLVGTSTILVDADGAGRDVQQRLAFLDREGPAPTAVEDLETARYAVTDLLDDLSGAGDDEAMVVAAHLWVATAELLLATNRRWRGTGKWLLRELQNFDSDCSTTHSDELIVGVRAVAAGDREPMRRTVEHVLDRCGGRVFDGYRRDAPD